MISLRFTEDYNHYQDKFEGKNPKYFNRPAEGRIFILLFCVFLLFYGCSPEKQDIILISDENLTGPALHGLMEVESVLRDKNYRVVLSNDLTDSINGTPLYFSYHTSQGPVHDFINRRLPPDLPETPESLLIRKEISNNSFSVILYGSDPVGLMYASLDAAEKIRWTDSDDNPLKYIDNSIESPDEKDRSVSVFTMQRKYWESRMYDEAYWKAYFNLLAKSRINSFVVIFGYENGGFMAPPYPYFFNVSEYPGVKMIGHSAEDQERNVEAFRKMISLAHERGIKFMPGIWDHIYRGGVQSGGISEHLAVPDKPVSGLVWGLNGDNLAGYTKAALAKFIATFPEIDGLQFRIHWESGLKREETPGFWHEVFTMLKENDPGIHIDLRAKGLPDEVIGDAVDMGLNFRITTKYWMEQMGLPFHPTHINTEDQLDRRHGYADLLKYPKKYNVHWRLWSGGTDRVLLWGDPEYAKRFIESTKIYGGNSFEINEPLATKMEAQPHGMMPFQLLNPQYQYYEYEFERYWYFYELWGQLGYNPDMDQQYFEKQFEKKFGEKTGYYLRSALHNASMVLPMIVAATYRYNWFPMTRGWPEKMRMDDLPVFATAEGSDIQQFASFREEAEYMISGRTSTKKLPSETALWFSALSDTINEKVSLVEKNALNPSDKELISTLTDLKILANLAAYYSKRIPAAVQYSLFQMTGNPCALSDAIHFEKKAIEEWETLVKSAGDVYTDNLRMGICHGGMCGHWKDELVWLYEGLEKLEKKRDSVSSAWPGREVSVMLIPVKRLKAGDSLKIEGAVSGIKVPVTARCMISYGHGFQTYKMNSPDNVCFELKIPGIHDIPEIRYYLTFSTADGMEVIYPSSGKLQPLVTGIYTDTQPPHIEFYPLTRPRPGQPVEIHVVASDESGIKWVRLRYRHLTQYEDYKSIDMSVSENGAGDYKGVIPGNFVEFEWDLMYFIEAMDQNGNARMYPEFEKGMPYKIIELDRE